jgi:putative colanic acid biosynthesis UDP-glucose lipid carrier transferase
VAIELQRSPRGIAQRALKRSVDFIIASCTLVFLLPLMAIVAIAIKLESPGPIIFRQTRHGFNGKPFKIFKFRSMTVLEDGEVIPQVTVGDSRLTRIGAFIRMTSIDELPQLFNVLKGDMSIVGPRPHAASHDRHFFETIDNYAFRHHVKPGITGWAQIHGHRGKTPTSDMIQRRVEFDLWYINNWSPWLDFLIMFRTLGAVARRQNAC